MLKHRHQKRKHKKKSTSPLFSVTKELDRIEEIIEDGDLPKALDKLNELTRRAPHRVEPFETLFAVASQLNDSSELLQAAIRLTELQPYVPAHYFNLYGVYKQNILPALAVQTARHFLSRWPDLELGLDMRNETDELSHLLQTEALKWGLPQDSWLEALVLHERVQVALLRNRMEEVRQLATQLITLVPSFVAAYNNRSLAYFSNGQLNEAIADARRVLELDPDNVHALGNLTRFLRLSNRLSEARETAERLKATDSAYPDAWVKKAEAFSYLADDASVLQIAEQAEKAGVLFSKDADPLLLHLTAVAAARLGQEMKARRFWQETIKRAPSFSRARIQLEDIKKPAGERNGPWAFDLADWLSPRLLEDFVKIVGGLKTSIKSENIKPLQTAARGYVQRYPQLLALVPVLLERGDSFAREFSLRLAQLVETPESLAAVKEFALSPNGPDKLRFDALQILREAGIVHNGQQIQFWTRGKQTEIMLMSYKIDDAPYEMLPPEARKLHGTGLEALKRNELDEAEHLLSQALQEAPDSASIQHNLALLEVQRGNITKARTMLQAISQRHPKYAFAPTQLALIEIANGHLENAHDLLKRVGSLEHFHHDEFATYCKAQIFFSILDKSDSEASRKWLEVWERFAPDDTKIESMRPFVTGAVLARLQVKRMLMPLRE